MGLFKCIECKEISLSYKHFKKDEKRLCKNCLNFIMETKRIKQKICPVCSNSGIDNRTYPSSNCNCEIEKELIL